jgi:hypothetical protein
MFWISWPTIWVELRGASFGRIKVKCKNFGELLDMERPDRNSEAMEKMAGMFLIVFVDILQHPFIRFVQCLWQLLKNPAYIWLDRVPQSLELAEHPLKPARGMM